MRRLVIKEQLTSRDSIAVEKYLNEISKLDLLSTEEEADLAAKIREGDDDALQELVRANLRFVVSVAKQYQHNGLSLSDLINEGNVGLIKAAHRFDETRGFKFISFAVWYIRQSILNAIVEHSRIVRRPKTRKVNYTQIQKVRQSYIQEFEREPSVDELADILDSTADAIRSILHSSTPHTSFDAPVSQDDGSSAVMLDFFVKEDEKMPDSGLIKDSLSNEVANSLSHLSPREAEILAMSFGLGNREPLSIEEIADYFDLSKERTRQIKDRALRRLRKIMVRNAKHTFDI